MAHLTPSDAVASVGVLVNPNGVDTEIDVAVGGFLPTTPVGARLVVFATGSVAVVITGTGFATCFVQLEYTLDGLVWLPIAEARVDRFIAGSEGDVMTGSPFIINLDDGQDLSDLDVRLDALASGGADVSLSGAGDIQNWRVELPVSVFIEA